MTDNLSFNLTKDKIIKVGSYLQKKDARNFIEITNIELQKNKETGEVYYISYKTFDLESLTVHEALKRQEFWFKNNYKLAQILSEKEANTIWELAKKPIPEKEQEELISEFKSAVKAENPSLVENLLTTYFQKVVIRESEKIKTFFELRTALPKRFRPCLCLENISLEILANFYQRLNKNLWELIPESSRPKIKRLTNRSEYKADPEDKNLQNLITPFVKTDSFRVAMHGVNFDEFGIAATNAHILLFLPKIKLGEKGVYCMTRKCFKLNNELDLVEEAYPGYRAVLPQKETNYESFTLDINRFRMIIKTLDENGFSKDKNHLSFHFRYGKDGFVVFNAKKNLLPALETFLKLDTKKSSFGSLRLIKLRS